jgi:hypothetical protein
MPKLQSKLPKGDANGLGPVAERMLRNPRRMCAIIAIVDCPLIEDDIDLDQKIPVIRIRRVEGILREDMDAAQRLMRRSLEYRTGRHVLALELEDEIQSAFSHADGGINDGEGDDDT